MGKDVMSELCYERMDEMFSDDVMTIAQALERWNTYLGRQFGPLSRPQQRTLRLLAERQVQQEMVRVGELAEPLGVTTAGITRMLDTLEGLGYITRSRTPNTDQREVYVTLTETGAQALQEADQVLLGRVQILIERLDGRERDELVILLRKIVPC